MHSVHKNYPSFLQEAHLGGNRILSNTSTIPIPLFLMEMIILYEHRFVKLTLLNSTLKCNILHQIRIQKSQIRNIPFMLNTYPSCAKILLLLTNYHGKNHTNNSSCCFCSSDYFDTNAKQRRRPWCSIRRRRRL